MAGVYRHNYGAFGRNVLCAPWMIAEMEARAQRGKDFAEAIAPDAPPYGVGYKESFEVSSGIRRATTRRAYGRVTNTDPAAMFIEFGTEEGEDALGRHHGATPRHRVLGRTLDVMGGA